MPNSHTIRITPNWLLGFTEGEGCFYVDKKEYNYMSSFIITVSSLWSFNEKGSKLFK